jgi:hypothetical protein
MAEEKIPTWLYHKQKGAKIHALAPGAPLPKGWRDTPWPEEKPAREKQDVKKDAKEAENETG